MLKLLQVKKYKKRKDSLGFRTNCNFVLHNFMFNYLDAF